MTLPVPLRDLPGHSHVDQVRFYLHTPEAVSQVAPISQTSRGAQSASLKQF